MTTVPASKFSGIGSGHEMAANALSRPAAGCPTRCLPVPGRERCSTLETMKNLAPDYRTMSVAERIQLVEDIWDSIVLDSPESIGLTAAQREEVRRRVAAHDADPSSAVEWDAVRAELFQRNLDARAVQAGGASRGA